MRNNGRIERLERQVRQLSVQDEHDARLRQAQQHSYEQLCEALDCTPDEVPYDQYVPVWWESSVLTVWIQQAAPEEALCWLAQQHCPVVRSVLERFLQRPRFVDPLWPLQHKLLPYRADAYEHFLATVVNACHTVWLEIAAAWLTLGYQAQSWLLQCWLCVGDPAQCQWDETTPDEAKRADLAAVLTRLYEEYNTEVVNGRFTWEPGIVYAGYAFHNIQPGAMAGTMESWQHHCARQLQARWVAQAMDGAATIDQAALLAQAQEAPDETHPHSSGRRTATKRSRSTLGKHEVAP